MSNEINLRPAPLLRAFQRHYRYLPAPGNMAQIIYQEIVHLCMRRRQLNLNTTTRVLALSTGFTSQQVLLSLLKMRASGLFERCVFTPESDLIIIQLKNPEYEK